MKFLETRTEIAKAINFKQYPTIRIYDAPRELSEFLLACPNSWYCESCAMYRENNGTCGNESLQIKHAPQSWCYVEAMEDV